MQSVALTLLTMYKEYTKNNAPLQEIFTLWLKYVDFFTNQPGFSKEIASFV
ncbi:MAG: hypothetical protein ACJAS4_003573 [Bacteriovoracaceae bacterium]